MQRIETAEHKLAELWPKLNRAHLKRQDQILGAAKEILEHYRVQEFLEPRLQWHRQITRKRPRGRPPRGKVVCLYQH